MLGKASTLIFLLSINIFAEISMQDELSSLRSASENVELSQWQVLAPKKKIAPKQETMIIEDSIGLKSSALKKEEAEELPASEDNRSIRYRSR